MNYEQNRKIPSCCFNTCISKRLCRHTYYISLSLSVTCTSQSGSSSDRQLSRSRLVRSSSEPSERSGCFLFFFSHVNREHSFRDSVQWPNIALTPFSEKQSQQTYVNFLFDWNYILLVQLASRFTYCVYYRSGSV